MLSPIGAGAAYAQSLVERRSTEAMDGTRTRGLAAVMPAPAVEVWKALATTERFRRLAAPFAIVDARRGCSFETSDEFEATAGDLDNIRSETVAIAPGRMIAVRNAKAPHEVWSKSPRSHRCAS